MRSTMQNIFLYGDFKQCYQKISHKAEYKINIINIFDFL